MAHLLKTDGTQTEIQPKNGKKFTFEELYPVLDTDTIEPTELSDGRWMLSDENILFNSERVINQEASRLFQQGRVFARWMLEDEAHLVYGDVVICQYREF